MANNSNQVQKTLGEQMADLLRRKPKNFDVTFSVGPDKIKVEAVKFILKAASPVFETEFEEKWENGVVMDGNGIPLPDIDHTAFQLFVNLLILDAWSLDSVKSLKLSPKTLLNLLGLCRRYEITKAIANLEEAVDFFIQSFAEYADTDEFLKLSRENLETIFSIETLPLNESKIFDCAARYGRVQQCTIKGLKPTGENYRKVPDTCLFQIRFPTMSTEEFTKVCKLKNNVLKGDEQLTIFLFIGSTIDEKTNYDTTLLPFKTNCRVAVKPNRINRTVSEKALPQIITNNREVNTSPSSGCSVLSLPPKYKLTSCPSFACDGSQRYHRFQVNHKISLHGFGFLGPINGDANFDVTVQLNRYDHYTPIFESETFRKNIFAQRGKFFRFLLDKPIALESSKTYGSWGNHYGIWFSLKGPYNMAQYKMDNPKDESLEVSGVQFHLHRGWNDENPLAELLFKKI